jgi:oligopeptidase B
MVLTRVLKASLTFVFLQIVVSTTRAEIDPNVATPPVANKIPKTTQIHGDTRVDNYFWLREKQNPEVIAYLEAENRYTAAVMKPAEGFQEALYAEMLGRIKQTDLSVPYQLGDWWYYTRTEKGKQYPIHCRRRGSSAGVEQVMLDLNEMAKGKKFLGLGAHVVSDDANLLAYTTDETGFREYRLHVRDLRTGKDLADHFDAKVTSVAWAADNRTLFYVADDAAKRPYRLYRHVLGKPTDDLVYEEKDELYRLGCRRSRDKAYIFAASQSSITSECRYLPSDQPTQEFRLILPREKDHEYYVDHRKGLFYIRTNKGAKNFRVVTVPVDDPSPGRWKEMIPHRKTVLLEGTELFARHCVVAEREEGLQRFHVYDLESGKNNVTDFTEPVYSVFAEQNPEFNTKLFRFRYQSLITPESIFDYDMDTQSRTLLKQVEVLGGYNPAQYRSERLFATAADGTRIPISIVYKSGVRQDGTAPMLLYGYGSYGFSVPITFQSQRLSFLDRGVVFAMAHIRGGSEMGRAWHDNGKMMSKRNTFTDFIAAADYLVEKKYASRERLAIQGGSAGGLLIGAVLNMRPDLCKAAVLMVPFVDVINTMLDPTLPLTVQEYLEWGNPNKRAEYEYIKSYCPYTNLGARNYPAILVMTSLNDSQVMYWEPAKYVAKMRATKADKNPLLLKVRMAGGHGGASGRYDALRDAAFVASFLLNELGITK